jgi:hypothetical protein
MKYIIIANNKITVSQLNALNEGGSSAPTPIYLVEPDFPTSDGTLSNYSYVTSQANFPDGFENHKKLSQTEFDEAVVKIKKEDHFETEIQPLYPKSKEHDRLMTATNRIASGYTQYCTGMSDDVANDSFGTGAPLEMDKNNTQVTFNQLQHFYIIGAKAYFDSECSPADKVKASMVAPASTGWSDNGSNTGNANKIEVAPGSGALNMYILVPAPLNDGNVDLDLAAFRSGSTRVLANTPVPQAGNTGYFNYNADTNTITSVDNPAAPNGGYQLYTFDITLHRFAENLPGMPGQILNCEAADIVGKRFWNFWDVRLELVPEAGTSRNPKAYLIFNIGVQGNVN